jgi:hypothetical protein
LETFPHVLAPPEVVATQPNSRAVSQSYGFAPNPFYGVLTLNCCKPMVRQQTEVGDWIAATTAADSPAGRGLLVYAARVTEKMTMAEYDEWTRRELPEKIPDLSSPDYRRKAGDSQYDFDHDPPRRRRGFHQPPDMATDLSGRYTLLCREFVYFGGDPMPVPKHLRPVILKGRGHKSRANDPYVETFAGWIGAFELGRLYDQPMQVPGRSPLLTVERKA